MKQIIFIAGILAALFSISSCKKDKQPSKPLYLSKVFDDALLRVEYIYSADKKPLRRNIYSTGTGQSVFNGFRLYEYDATGSLSLISIFDKNSVLYDKYRVQYDANGRPTRMDDLAADNGIQYYYLMDYNGDKLEKSTLYNASTNKKNTDAVYTYSANGTIAKIIRRSYASPVTVLYDSSTFTFSSGPLPAHWKYFEALPFVALPNGETFLYEMNFAGSYRYFVNAPPATTTTSYSAKVYNDENYLISQRVTTTHVDIGPPTISNRDMKYEYIE